MSKTLYLECYSGISGDMTVSALLDLGAEPEVLKKALESLKVEGYEIEIGRRQKCGIDACFFDVILDQEEHHHEHAYSHGQGEEQEHSHSHGDEHTHDHNHSHAHEHDHSHSHEHTHPHQHSHHHHGDGHVHRNVRDIYEIIDQSGISERAKALSKKIFDVVAEAESKAHGIGLQEVHFHEVGAVDSIVDIVATAVCIDNLGLTDVIVSELYEGSGHVRCQHGVLPVPVPAVTNIAMAHSLKMRITDIEGELVTPTGAAIVAALGTKEALPASYTIKKIGIGSGKKELPKANILRAYIIEENKKKLH